MCLCSKRIDPQTNKTYMVTLGIMSFWTLSKHNGNMYCRMSVLHNSYRNQNTPNTFGHFLWRLSRILLRTQRVLPVQIQRISKLLVCVALFYEHTQIKSKYHAAPPPMDFVWINYNFQKHVWELPWPHVFPYIAHFFGGWFHTFCTWQSPFILPPPPPHIFWILKEQTEISYMFFSPFAIIR